MSFIQEDNIPAIVRNDDGIYEGNLIPYFQLVFFHTQNLDLAYHNFCHISYILWLCDKASRFYKNALSKRRWRDLFVAVLFHDFDHTGTRDDSVNIRRAIAGLQNHILEEDRKHQTRIVRIIEMTQYPYTEISEDVGLGGCIARDADSTQCFTEDWIQPVIFGLAKEWKEKPIDILRKQRDFLEHLSFLTTWARKTFPKEVIARKIKEVDELLELVETQGTSIAKVA